MEAGGLTDVDHDGCFADLPEDECYSACGGGRSIVDEPDYPGCEGVADGTASGSSGGTAGDTATDVGATDDPATGSATANVTGSETTGGTTEGPGCEGNEDCSDGAAPFCDGEGVCVSCDGMPDGNAACGEADEENPVCDAGECVQCTAGDSEACDGQTPICDEEVRTCGACTEHSECPDSACHLDGVDVGGCFDEGDVQVIANVGQLNTALGGLGANDQVVLVLAAGTYGSTLGIGGSAEVAILGQGAPILAGDGSRAVDAFASGIVYLSGVEIVNGSGDGISCSGTSVWLDDSEVRNNAQVGLDVSGGCAAHLRRTVVAVNNGGGIDQVGGELRMTNSVVALNGGSVSPFGGLSIDGVDILVSYTTIAGNDSQNTGMSIRCSGANTGEVRNSIVSGEDASSVDPCAGVSVLSSRVDEGGLGGTNTNVGAFDPGWFSNPATGNYHLTGSGETVFMDIADWQAGDPLFDVDGDPIPTDMPSFPGYDQP